MYELPQVGIAMTMPHIVMLAHMVLSWSEKTPNPGRLLDTSLLADVFKSIGMSWIVKKNLWNVNMTKK